MLRKPTVRSAIFCARRTISATQPKTSLRPADGDVARLVEVKGQPLSVEANQAELERLHTLADHPEIQQHRHQREQKDAARVDRLMRLLPEAFLYRYEGMTGLRCGVLLSAELLSQSSLHAT